MTDPVISPDGKHMWTGSEWIPAPGSNNTSVSFQDSVVTGDVIIMNNNIDDISKAIIKLFPSAIFNRVLNGPTQRVPSGVELIDVMDVSLDIPKNSYINKLEEAKSSSDSKAVASSLFNLGVYSRLEENFVEAKIYFEDCIDLYKTIGDEEGMTKSAVGLGTILFLTGCYNEAEKLYKDSLDIALTIEDKSLLAAVYYNLGILHKYSEMIFEPDNFWVPQQEWAKDNWGECLKIFREINDISGQIDSLFQLAEFEFGTSAESMYGEILSLSSEVRDQRNKANALLKLGEISEWLDKRIEADSYYKKCYHIINMNFDDKISELAVSSKIASNCYKMGELEEAQQLYLDILHTSRQLNDVKHEAYSLFYLGKIANHNSSFEEAKRLLQECYAISTEIDNPTITAELLIQLGIFALENEDEEEKQKYFHEAQYDISTNNITLEELEIENVGQYEIWDLFNSLL
jgi:tetratricopeptide (TPR) repeat protein